MPTFKATLLDDMNEIFGHLEAVVNPTDFVRNLLGGLRRLGSSPHFALDPGEGLLSMVNQFDALLRRMFLQQGIEKYHRRSQG